MQHRLIALLIFLMTANASACMWDYDTLRDEQRGLPGVFEILTGRYEKRSEFFYRDRIAKMRALLTTDPNNQPAIDNLAVALFRVGQHDEAIATTLDKEKRFPDQYTTSSNLATFYMLTGDSASAVPLLEKALRINPNAHFGREKYQLMLAKFLLSAKAAQIYPTEDFLGADPFASRYPGTTEPAEMEPRPNPLFIHRNWSKAADLDSEGAAALQGILGMIRFGTDQSPDLWYALGNLLLQKGDRNLAVRAYARAIETKHPRSKDVETVKDAAESSIADDAPNDLLIQRELWAGHVWADSYMAFTDELIRAGKDPEDESNFAAFYQKAGKQTPALGWDWHDWIPAWGSVTALIAYTVLGLLGALILIRVARLIRRKLQAVP